MNIDTAATDAQTANKASALPQSLAQFSALPDDSFVRLPVVRGLIGNVGPATVWRWSKDGRLPAPVKLSPGVTAWNVGELRAHLAQCRGQ